MYRARILTLTNNADAAAVETARAALTAASGQPVLPGGKVTFTARINNESITAGNFVGFARMPLTLNADRSVSAWQWVRWAGGDFDVNNVSGTEGLVTQPVDVPIGATAVISLPLAVSGTSAVTDTILGIFFHLPSSGA